ncbi:hypothetical protein AC579_4653 [Pseudocercospora musae]|uniref:Uncharacterized protein n=1 Tax=Pseudocercospora musae TaxID=113226 RepID=A0A139IBE4_9PEZI|nr:hypothetical protein AC579_4653 [Pseudocercospora musae]
MGRILGYICKMHSTRSTHSDALPRSMSSEVADLENGYEDLPRTENEGYDIPVKDATSLTKLDAEQHEKATLGADNHVVGNASSRGDDAQNSSRSGISGLDSGDRNEDNDVNESGSLASRLRRLALDQTSLGNHVTLKQDILIKVTLLPCVMGLRDAMIMNLKAEQVRKMRESSKLAVKLAVNCNAPAATVARCHFYQALVNMAIGMDTGDSQGEKPIVLLEQVMDIKNCVERDCAGQWLAKLDGRKISTPQKTDNRRSLGHRVVSWGASFFPNFSPYKSTPEKLDPTTQQDSVLEMLTRMVETPTTSNPPHISRRSPSTEAPDSARPVLSPVTPTKQKTRTSEPQSRASQVSHRLSDLYELSPRSGASRDGEKLDNLSMSDWQSRPNSRISVNSNISASPNTPFKTKEGSSRRPYPLRHRSSGVDGDGSPKSSPATKSILRFSYPGEKAYGEEDDEEGGEEEEDALPAPNTSRQKHHRSRSLALRLTSPSKQSESDNNIFGDWSPPSPRRKTSIVNLLGFGRAKTEVWDPHDEAERGSPRRATFAATQAEMEDLMEKGDSPRMMEFSQGDKTGSIGETR